MLRPRWSFRSCSEKGSLRHAFLVLEEIEATPEHRLQVVSMIFGNDSLRAGHADKRARWTELLAPLVATRLPPTPACAFEARAIVAVAVTGLQIATEEWVRQGGRTPMFDRYDTAIAAVRTVRS